MIGKAFHGVRRVLARLNPFGENSLFGLLVATYMMVQTGVSLWDHNIAWSFAFGFLGVANFALLAMRSPSQPPAMNFIVSSGFDPDRLMELDERLAACARALGQEPTSDKMIEVVTDLRGIVRDLNAE